MKKTGIVALALSLVFVAISARAQSTVPVRGTIISLDGDILGVKTREGRDMKIEMAKDVSIAYTRVVKLVDIKPGTAVGAAAVEGPDGKLVAQRVQVFPPDRGLPNEGHRPMAEPHTTMTNALVTAQVQANSGRELTLTYKGGSKVVLVPENTPVVTPVPGDRSYLVPGEYVFINTSMNNDGKLTATRIQVSRDGVRPPQ